MTSTLSFTLGDVQAAKACIAAAVAEVPLKVHANKPGSSATQLLLSPAELTQSNAIAQYLGEAATCAGFSVMLTSMHKT